MSSDDQTAAERPDYDAYIASDAWRCRRDLYILAHDYACFRCHATRRLELHHLTYERLGAELDGDLCWLCASCHVQQHWRIGMLDPGEPLPITPEQREAITNHTRKARLRIVERCIVAQCPDLAPGEAYAKAVAHVYGAAV